MLVDAVEIVLGTMVSLGGLLVAIFYRRIGTRLARNPLYWSIPPQVDLLVGLFLMSGGVLVVLAGLDVIPER
jgi:hypothetical protein